MKKIGIVVLIIISLIIVLFLSKILLLAIFNGGDIMLIDWASEVDRKSENIRKEEKIDLANIENLEIILKSSNMNITLTDDEELRIVQYANKTLEENQLFIVDKDNSSVKVSEKSQFHLFFYIEPNIAYDVYIPKKYNQNLKLQAVSGDISTTQNLTLKDVDINLTSGDIELLGTLEADNIKIKAVSGDIKIQKVSSENLEISSTSGDIKLVEANSQNLNVTSTSGNIKIEETKNKTKGKTVSGDITINKIQGKVEAESTSGNINLNQFLINEASKIKTVSGDVEIHMNSESNCQIETKTTSGDVDLPDGRNTMGTEQYNMLKIQTTSGNIRIDVNR